MPARKPAEDQKKPRPAAPLLPADPRDLRHNYANGVIVNHSKCEFTLTFVRADHLFMSPDEMTGTAPMGVATRVAMSHAAMKEFLDVAIANYQSLRGEMPDLPALKLPEEHADE